MAPTFSEDLGSISFARMREAIQAGYDAVMQHRDQYERLALDDARYAAYVASLNDPRMQELPVVEFVRLDNNSPIADSVVETRLSDIHVGEQLDVDQVERAMNKVYGLEYYQNVRYGLVTDEGKTGLEVELDERSWGPNYLQLGMEYSSAGDEDALFGLAASYLRTAINDRGGEWRATFVIGDEPALLSDYYQPFGERGLYFFAPSLNFQSNIFNVWEDDIRVTEAQIREGELELGIGRELPSWAEYRFGVRARTARRSCASATALLPAEDFRRGELFGRFSVDTMDSVSFPRSGTLASMEWRGVARGTARRRALRPDAARGRAREDLGPAHDAHDVPLRRDDQRRGAARIGCSARAASSISRASTATSCRASTWRASARAWYRRIGDLALFPAFAGVSMELGNVFESRSDISIENSILGGSFWAGVRHAGRAGLRRDRARRGWRERVLRVPR